MKKFGFLGLISLILGVVLVINSFSGMTGFAISEKIPGKSYSIFGIVFILGGMVLLFLESKKGNLEKKVEISEEKEEILETLEDAKEHLSRSLGIENLSNIEAFRLRKLIEKCLKQGKKEENLINQGKIRNTSGITPYIEASAQWLLELYNIDERNVPLIYTIRDYDNEKTYEYDGFLKEDRTIKNKTAWKVNKKELELSKQGFNVDIENQVPDYYKEYIRRQREKAHKP